ncbi:hypothetical protein D4764_22G0001290 [Takifugu flavidus]|uniref:Uncharacterized protein n=1 Tax=Takifugu flavidus TaxID=433684 RepID=A0A5C6NAH5_9TELE|nr:hypothetical protein D4764_22G0001290 [Takifugu flavidus]
METPWSQRIETGEENKVSKELEEQIHPGGQSEEELKNLCVFRDQDIHQAQRQN